MSNPIGRGGPLPLAPTPLVGRDAELALALADLRTGGVRLLTLTGPGGIGKTRLALAIAAALDPEFADGACFVSLAEFRDPDQAASAIAQALGVHPGGGRPLLDALGDAVRQRRQLLLLDNFEQVVAAVPVVAALLAAGPGTRVLVTSREALNVRGEHVRVVAPLAVPDRSQPPSLERIARAPAAANAAAVADICARLDGVPLAIELAAAHAKHWPPSALLARLSRRLDLLAGGARDLPDRLRSMRAAVAWSYDLLSPEEQDAFRHLSVCGGGFDLLAAHANLTDGERVSGGRSLSEDSEPRHPIPDTPRLVTALIDKSLLHRLDPSAEAPRFALLETVREFALDRLAATGDEPAARGAHAAYFLSLAEDVAPRLHGAGQARGSTGSTRNTPTVCEPRGMRAAIP